MLSPDGTSVVYVENNNELRVAPNVVGTRPTTVIVSSDHVYLELVGRAPDGRAVLVMRYTQDDGAQLVWASIDRKTLRPLRTLGHRDADDRASLSPDGRHVAYGLLATPRQRNAQGQWVASAPEQHIYVMQTDGSGNEQRIVGGSNINESPVWTPDGTRILFVSNRDGAFGLWHRRGSIGGLDSALHAADRLAARRAGSG
jgi:Tol biopolymer transport system component